MRERESLVVTAAAVALAALASLHAVTFMATFNTAPSAAIVKLAPTPIVAPAEAGAPPVVLFVADGLIADGVGLLQLPASSLQAASRCELQTIYPSFSRPSYVALLTGAPPTLSGVHTNRHRGSAGVESVVAVARRSGLDTHVASDEVDWWGPLFGPWTSAHFGAERFEAALSPLLNGAAGGLWVVHMVIGDAAGHDHGAASAEYASAMGRVGRVLEQVRRAVVRVGGTLIAVSDHGHLPRGGHGGPEPAVLRVPVLSWGPRVVPPDELCGRPGHRRTVDIAPTLAGLLGVPPPAQNTGRLMAGLLAPAHRSAAQVRTDHQRARLTDALGGTTGTTLEDVVPRHRSASVAVGLSVATVWVLLLLLAFFKVIGRLPRPAESLSSSLFTVLFVVGYAAAEPTLSFSAVWVRNEWIGRMILLVALAWAVAIVVRLRLPSRAHQEVSDAMGQHMLHLGLACLPLLTAWGLHGSWGGGPELGEPHSAFALIVGDLLLIGAALGTLVTLAWPRLRPTPLG